MSYLGTLVETPAVAAVQRRAEPALEQHVEIESSASLPVSVASEHVPAVPEQRSTEAAKAAPTASVEDALRGAFEWVSPRPMSPAIKAEAEMPTSTSTTTTRGTELEIRSQATAVPVRASQTLDPPQIPQALERYKRTIALPALSQVVERTGLTHPSTEAVELTTFESTPTVEPEPRRRITAAQRAPSHEAASAEERPAPTHPSPVQVRIGSISLNVRTPPPPAPAPRPAATVFAPAPERPAPSAAFAFSARRHHLRWG